MNRIIGITGGMGSGKTTLSKKIMQENADFIYIDVDIFRRNLLRNSEYVNELKKVIPELNSYYMIDSSILNRYIYGNDEYMRRYKKILYRYLFNYLRTFEDKTILVDWALIFNDNLEGYFDEIICLEASENVRLERLKDSDLDKNDILKRFRLQTILDWDERNLDNVLFLNSENEIDMNQIREFINGISCKFTLPNNEGKAIWEITHRCNYGCSYCIFSCTKNFKAQGELTTEECFHVIDELYNNGFRHLKITGGEPFLRKDIIDVLRYASTKLITDISTNASLLTEEKIRQLNELRLKMIHVSLDGNLIEHESVRGKNTYWQTIKGLEMLKSSTNRVRIGAVIHANNERNLEGLVKDSEKLFADEIIFSIMEPIYGQDRSLYKKRPNEDLINELNKLQVLYGGKIKVNYNFGKQTYVVHRCPAGDKFLYINNLGQISPCPWIHEIDKSCISSLSLRNQSLEEILKDKKLTKFLEAKKRGLCYGQI